MTVGALTCPCCGQPLASGRVPIEGLRDAPLAPSERRAVGMLIDAFPRHVRKETIVDALWGDDPNGGPDIAYKMVDVIIYRLRRHLPQYGWTVPKGSPGRGHYGLYRLEPLP